MRVRFCPARIGLIAGIVLAVGPTAWGQATPEPQVQDGGRLQIPEEGITPERSVTVAGRILGPMPLQSTETMVILLMAGWSDTLSSEIASGLGPSVSLKSGTMRPITAPGIGARDNPQWTGSFEFRDVAPGEYQAVAVRFKDGSESGNAIAEGARLIVKDRDIRDLELAIVPPSRNLATRRAGSAEEREAALLGAVGRAPVENIRIPTRPVTINRFPSSSQGKKDILSHILVGLGIAASIFMFSR